MKMLKFDKNFWQVDIGRKAVAPFPGRYPTRWQLLHIGRPDTKVIHFSYTGRPSYPQWLAAAKSFERNAGYVFMNEFDRLGPFRQACLLGPLHNDHEVRRQADLIYRYYYPWHYRSHIFYDPWNHPVYSKLIQFNSRSFYVYSPYEKMWEDSGFDHLRGHRTWLRSATGLLWK